MGDAAGIGPEIIMKALAVPGVHAICKPLVIGDADAAAARGPACRQPPAGGGRASTRATRSSPRAASNASISAWFRRIFPSARCRRSRERRLSATSSARCASSQAGEAQAICTAPLSKEALHAAGHKYPGHTELLAALTGTPEVSMMLVAPKLRVIHVTTHMGLLDAIERIDAPLVERVIGRAHLTLTRAGIAHPRIGVCGINPHAGENGLFGRGEEAEKIDPAVRNAQARGWDVRGPLPADTLFFLAARGDYDIVVAMYHDQGHGPVKVLGLEAGVNITVGLPMVRTSVDHGTAFDIAGTGVADERSLIEALRQAADLAPR